MRVRNSPEPDVVRGQLEMRLSDGRSLHAACDVDLARQWAEAIHGQMGWAQLSPAQQQASTAEALAELRRAYAQRSAAVPAL